MHFRILYSLSNVRLRLVLHYLRQAQGRRTDHKEDGRRTIQLRLWVQRVARHSSSKVDVNVKQLIGLSGSEGRFFSGPFQMAISFHKWEAIKLNASNVAAEHGQKTGRMEAVSRGPPFFSSKVRFYCAVWSQWLG